MFQIQTIRDNVDNLKKYFDDNPTVKPVYFCRHLLHKMYIQRKELQPKFSALYQANDEPRWEIIFKTAKFYIVDNYDNKFRDSNYRKPKC